MRGDLSRPMELPSSEPTLEPGQRLEAALLLPRTVCVIGVKCAVVVHHSRTFEYENASRGTCERLGRTTAPRKMPCRAARFL